MKLLAGIEESAFLPQGKGFLEKIEDRDMAHIENQGRYCGLCQEKRRKTAGLARLYLDRFHGGPDYLLILPAWLLQSHAKSHDAEKNTAVC